jgi:hypothetical protein
VCNSPQEGCYCRPDNACRDGYIVFLDDGTGKHALLSDASAAGAAKQTLLHACPVREAHVMHLNF